MERKAARSSLGTGRRGAGIRTHVGTPTRPPARGYDDLGPHHVWPPGQTEDELACARAALGGYLRLSITAEVTSTVTDPTTRPPASMKPDGTATEVLLVVGLTATNAPS